LNNIASPYGLALISYAFFLFACLIPPSVYTHYMEEPDLMFLDPVAIFFYTLCVASFVAGVWLIGWIFPSVSPTSRTFDIRIAPLPFLLTPLVLGVALAVLTSVLVLKSNPYMIPLLLSQQAGELKDGGAVGLELQGTHNITFSFLIGVIWWTFWRYYQSGVPRRGKSVVRFMLFLAMLVLFVSSSLIVSRHPLTVSITGFAIVYILRKAFSRQLTWMLAGRTALIFVLGGSVFFFSLTWLRGDSDVGSVIGTFWGYTIASYNRLSALLQGALHFELVGKGIYFSNFLSFNGAFNHVIPYGKLMDLPYFLDAWGASFSSVGIAGLRSTLIFCGAFGELYIELGWLAPLYVLCSGLLYGIIWREMKHGGVAGVLLYPYCAYCILFWFTTNGLFDADIVALIIDALILGAYERLFVSRHRAFVSVSQAG
jgi:hypothetical protein